VRLAAWLGLILAGVIGLFTLLSLPDFDVRYPVLFVIGFVACVLGIVVGLAGAVIDVYRWIRRRDCDPERLRQAAENLAREITEWHADRRRGEPRPGLPWAPDATEAERHAAWQMQTDAMTKYFLETMIRYGERYRARSLALFDRLHACGLIRAEQRAHFQHPTNSFGIDEVVNSLVAVAAAVPAKDQASAFRSQ
jgi:hypothetical protein